MIHLLLTLLLFAPSALQQVQLFDQSDYRLDILRIRGENPGPTVLIFGGIHGDEPGGYFSSEMLSRVRLKKGNLIVVPRVNFPSIMLNRRQVRGDMNRKFTPNGTPGDPEQRVVEALKELMKEADLFINQHDANGFHREKYISPRANPAMYGQSLIVDTAHFYSRRWGKEIDLQQIGGRIVARVNARIPDSRLHFGFWNHYSLKADTRFPEMKSSATHYAVSAFSIPAFGLETSKDLPNLQMKVNFQLLVIEEILREFGLEFELPLPQVEIPQLHWVEFEKNDGEIIRVNDKTNLRLQPGDRLRIRAIAANSPDGLSADIVRWGSLNDLGKEFCFRADTDVVLKKNNFVIGRVYLRRFLADSLQRLHLRDGAGGERVIPNWGVCPLAAGETVRLTATVPATEVRLLVDGETVPGRTIHADRLRPAASFQAAGKIHFVRIYTGSRLLGGFQVELR